MQYLYVFGSEYEIAYVSCVSTVRYVWRGLPVFAAVLRARYCSLRPLRLPAFYYLRTRLTVVSER